LAKRIQLLLVLALGFVATGAQWDVLQAMAWGRMLANYSCAESVPQAVADTFSGATCSLCRAVEQAKQQEKNHAGLPVEKLSAKILLFCSTAQQIVVAAPAVDGLRPTEASMCSRERAMPPVPPPRIGSV